MKIIWLAMAMVALLAPVVCAENIVDSEPKMSWDDLLACKLVVIGKYDSHKDAVLSIKVERVLRSPATAPVKSGEVLDVAMEHWWNVETDPVGFEAMMKDAKGDGKTRLCYKIQMMNPGPLVPDPVLDPDESAIFFFPERRAVLKRSGQLLPAVQADGWQEALDGKPMNLTFRLAQGLNHDLETKAIAEFKTGRDKAIIALLIDEVANGTWIGGPTSHGLFNGIAPQDLLIAIGDKHGDVYDVVRLRIDPKLQSDKSWPNYRLTEIMAQVDPNRAMKEFKQWLNDPAPDQKNMQLFAADRLGFVGTEEALNLAIDLVPDKDVGKTALWSVEELTGYRSSGLCVKYSEDQYKRFRAITAKRLKDEPPDEFLDGLRDWYKEMKRYYKTVDPPQ